MFKPLLAGKVESLNDLRFPCLMSIKLDGVRCTVQNGKLYSRTLKLIPNANVQKAFAGLPDGLDGELICGDPFVETAYRDTVSIVMSDDKPIGDVVFYLFDKYAILAQFKERIAEVKKIVEKFEDRMPVKFLPHTVVDSVAKLESCLTDVIDRGGEGIMTRSFNGLYKQGRSSAKEQILIKHKIFEDAEAEVTGVCELQRNKNEATTNALGRTERSTKKAGMVGGGVFGKFEVIGINGKYKGVAFEVGSGFDAEQREQFWKDRDNLIGQVISYKYFPTGSDTKPRFPIFLRIRGDAKA